MEDQNKQSEERHPITQKLLNDLRELNLAACRAELPAGGYIKTGLISVEHIEAGLAATHALMPIYSEHKEIIENPNFGKEKFIHNWERYIPAVCREHWKGLDCKTKAALWLMASELADNEEWE